MPKWRPWADIKTGELFVKRIRSALKSAETRSPGLAGRNWRLKFLASQKLLNIAILNIIKK